MTTKSIKLLIWIASENIDFIISIPELYTIGELFIYQCWNCKCNCSIVTHYKYTSVGPPFAMNSFATSLSMFNCSVLTQEYHTYISWAL